MYTPLQLSIARQHASTALHMHMLSAGEWPSHILLVTPGIVYVRSNLQRFWMS